MKTVKTLQLTFSLLMILFASVLSAQNIKIAKQLNTKASYATFTSLDGKWINTNPKALPTILISGNSTKLRAWGKCTPNNCPWGSVNLQKFGSKYKAVFDDPVAVRILIITPIAGGKLRVYATYNYKDSRPTKQFNFSFRSQSS